MLELENLKYKAMIVISTNNMNILTTNKNVQNLLEGIHRLAKYLRGKKAELRTELSRSWTMPSTFFQ